MILDKKTFKELEKNYEKDPKNKVIENAISNMGIMEASLNKNIINKHDFIFSNEVETKDVTNQRKAGRCWMFAGLNMIRMHIAKKVNMEKFELSESFVIISATVFTNIKTIGKTIGANDINTDGNF